MRRKFKVMVDGKEYVVEIEELGEPNSQAPIQPRYEIKPESSKPSTPKPAETSAEEGAVTSPMPGKILDIRVSKGDRVKTGDVLIILEAMKMENEIVAPKDGIVKEVRVNVGDKVDRGSVLIVIGE